MGEVFLRYMMGEVFWAGFSIMVGLIILGLGIEAGLSHIADALSGIVREDGSDEDEEEE